MKTTNSGSARYDGLGKDGKGHVSTQSGALKDQPYGFQTRFEDAAGTNPEELIAAAQMKHRLEQRGGRRVTASDENNSMAAVAAAAMAVRAAESAQKARDEKTEKKTTTVIDGESGRRSPRHDELDDDERYLDGEDDGLRLWCDAVLRVATEAFSRRQHRESGQFATQASKLLALLHYMGLHNQSAWLGPTDTNQMQREKERSRPEFRRAQTAVELTGASSNPGAPMRRSSSEGPALQRMAREAVGALGAIGGDLSCVCSPSSALPFTGMFLDDSDVNRYVAIMFHLSVSS